MQRRRRSGTVSGARHRLLPRARSAACALLSRAPGVARPASWSAGSSLQQLAILGELVQARIERAGLRADLSSRQHRRTQREPKKQHRDEACSEHAMLVPQDDDHQKAGESDTEKREEQSDRAPQQQERDAADLLLELGREQLEAVMDDCDERAHYSLARLEQTGALTAFRSGGHPAQRRASSKPTAKPIPAAMPAACHGLSRT